MAPTNPMSLQPITLHEGGERLSELTKNPDFARMGGDDAESGASFGFSIVARDFNGDGFADIVVTNQGTSSGQAGAGEVFVYFTPHP